MGRVRRETSKERETETGEKNRESETETGDKNRDSERERRARRGD